MARLVNGQGVVVVVDDEQAERLVADHAFSPADSDKPARKTAAKKTAPKSDQS